MSSPELIKHKPGIFFSRFFHRVDASLGIRLERKTEIYLDLADAATWRDPGYWLQIIFAAGVATLGLALNSPAVIIGAMLISPLMGPILSAGLSLATGDLILGLRAAIKLALSCLLAVGFAMLLVSLLPFREMTAEIAARTRPNTLDLVVALFSGAIGSIATCKEAKGVVTSIPGVAIAVALMPPLCVVGYGIGLAVTSGGDEGMRVAAGGGLLFLTNLVAITFTAMLVFLIVRIGVKPVTEQVREWRQTNKESEFVRQTLERLRITDKLREIGGARARFLVVLVPLLLLLIPLSRSLNQLRQEYSRQRQENQVRRVVTDLWQQHFGKYPDGQIRSYIDQLTLNNQDGVFTVFLRVFTNRPYTTDERREWLRLLAARINRPEDKVNLQLIDIPTSASELTARVREAPVSPPPTLAQLQANYWAAVEAALRGVRLPPPARLLDYRVELGATTTGGVSLSYLSDAEIGADARALIIEDVRERMNNPSLGVTFERIPASFTLVLFRRNQTTLPADCEADLGVAARALSTYPTLRLNVTTQADRTERPQIAEERARVIVEHLVAMRPIARDRIICTVGKETAPTASLRISQAEAAK